MPSGRLNNQSASIQKYDIVGCGSTQQNFFVCHVGLANQDRASVSLNSRIGVSHMQPPLLFNGEMAVHVIGSANLGEDERQRIKLFHDDFDFEVGSDKKRIRGKHAGYVIHPSYVIASDGTKVTVRFSCAGFVLKSYQEAGVNFIDDSQLPPVNLAFLAEEYPSHDLHDERLRRRYGLEGDGPWPILLCGYLFHSLNRDLEEIRSQPYRPQSGDECFPRQDS